MVTTYHYTNGDRRWINWAIPTVCIALALYLQTDSVRGSLLDGPQRNISTEQNWVVNLVTSFALGTFGLYWLISALRERNHKHQIELTATAITAPNQGRLFGKPKTLQLADLTEIQEISTDGAISIKLLAGKDLIYVPRSALAKAEDFDDLLNELKTRLPHCPANFYEVTTHHTGHSS